MQNNGCIPSGDLTDATIVFGLGRVAVNKAQFDTKKPAKNQMTMISITNTPAKPKEGSVFVGIVEPYAGEPFITKTGTVAINRSPSISHGLHAAPAQLIEVGDKHKMTAYTLTSIKPQGSKTVLTTLRGADYFLSPIRRIDIDPVNPPPAAAAQPEAAQADEPSETSEAAQESENTDDNTDVVTGSAPQGPVVNKIIASLALVPSPSAGRTKNWVLSNEDATKQRALSSSRRGPIRRNSN